MIDAKNQIPFDCTQYTPSSNLLENRTILVTGASRGIGRAVSKCLARYGATVLLLARTIQDLESLANEIIQENSPCPGIIPFNLCTATPEDYENLINQLIKTYNKLDGILHHAGWISGLTPIEHYKITDWYKTLQINLTSNFILTQALLPLLKASDHASIVFSLHPAALQSKANWGAFAIANNGCYSLMRILSQELQQYTNVRSNCVIPDYINTNFRNNLYPADINSQLQEPSAIVNGYLYLFGPDSQTIQGQTIVI